MSTHPNAMLLCVLTPDDLARKTYRAILAEHGIHNGIDDDDIRIGGETYHTIVMEENYNESNQIAAPEGSIVLWDLFTYGYGESKAWGELEKQKDELEAFIKPVCEKYHCSYEIKVSANYW